MTSPTHTQAIQQPTKTIGQISFRNSLHIKATALAILLSTLPVIFIGGLAYFFASQAIVRQITVDQTLRTKLAGGQIDGFLVSRLRELKSLAKGQTLTDASLRDSDLPQQKLDTFFRTLQYFDSIILFDTEGNPIHQAKTSQKPFEGNYSDRAYFQAALNTGKVTMNGPGVSKSSGKLRVEFAIPIKDSQTNEITAIIRARIPGSHLNQLFRNLEGEGDGWYLVDDSNVLFAGSDETHLKEHIEEHFPSLAASVASHTIGTDIIESHVSNTEHPVTHSKGHAGRVAEERHSEETRAEKHHAEEHHAEEHQHEHHHAEAQHTETASADEFYTRKNLVTYVPISLSSELPERKLGFVSYSDTSLSLAPQRRLAYIFTLGTAITTLLSGAIATILTKQLTDPIKRLTRTAQTIAQEGKFDLRVPVSRRDELGMLANSFNQLVEWVGLRTLDLEESQFDLEQRTQELSAIINSLGDGLLVADASGKITRFNPPLLKMFSLKREAILQQPVSQVFGPDVNQLIRQSQANPNLTFSREVPLAQAAIGQALVSTILDLETNQPLGCVILFRDITAEKEVDRMKTDFISTVSHELRTPLTSVLGFAKIIQKKLEKVVLPAVASEEKKTVRAVRQVKENLAIIISEGERLTSLINDVLDIAKIEAGKIEWRMAEVNPQTIIEHAIAATSALTLTNNITLKTDIAPNLPTVIADQDRLIQVVINLISNAIKFTDEGTVTCEVKRTEDELKISVIDTGIGISEEDQPKVFEKFKQVGEIMTDKPQGTGLGLPICKQIVEHHGGRIWVESELGHGSTFCVALPLATESAASETIKNPTMEDIVRRIKADVRQSAAPKAGELQTVLVVDDEDNIRRLLRQELETEGYLVNEAKDGVAALESIKRNPPHLIITDVMMPRLDGFDLTAVLKTNPETTNIPTIILSIVEDKERGFRVGVDRYLTKPIDINELLRSVDSLLTHKTSRCKVLVVNRDESTSKVLTEVLLSQGYVVAEASTGKEGLDKARSIKPDMMIVDAALSEEHNMVKTLRFEKGLENISVILMEGGEQAQLESVRSEHQD
ncbi:MAG: ATP-binding protein [Cyanobacteria bacterium J06614_10]